jgi:hypothetical protein
MGKKRKKKQKRTPAEEEAALYEAGARSCRRAPEPNLLEMLLSLREVVDRENISEAAAGELLRGNVVLRGDGRTSRSRSSPRYIHDLVHHIPYNTSSTNMHHTNMHPTFSPSGVSKTMWNRSKAHHQSRPRFELPGLPRGAVWQAKGGFLQKHKNEDSVDCRADSRAPVGSAKSHTLPLCGL